MLKLKLQYFGHLMQSQLIEKDPDNGKDLRQKEEAVGEDKMVRWHHWLNGLEFEQAPGNLVCRGSCGHKELDMT